MTNGHKETDRQVELDKEKKVGQASRSQLLIHALKINNNISSLCSAERHNAILTPGWNCSQLPTFPLWVCNKSTDMQFHKKLQLWVQKNNYVTVKPLHDLI